MKQLILGATLQCNATYGRNPVSVNKEIMKYILLIFMIVSVIACRKNDNLSSSNNGSKLTAISSDSAGAWRFGYTGDLITSMVADTSLRPYGFNASIQYSHTGSIDYVTVNSITIH